MIPHNCRISPSVRPSVWRGPTMHHVLLRLSAARVRERASTPQSDICLVQNSSLLPSSPHFSGSVSNSSGGGDSS